MITINAWITAITVTISVISLMLGIINLYRSLDKIEMDWHTQIVKYKRGDVICSNSSSFPLPVLTQVANKMDKIDDSVDMVATLVQPFMLQFTAINYGKNDMGYWSLHVTDDQDREVPVYTQKQVNRQGTKNLLVKTHPSQWERVTIPQDSVGMFKSQSYTEWNVFIDLNGFDTRKITAEVAITKKRLTKLFKPHVYIGSTYVYDLADSSVVIQSKDIQDQSHNGSHQSHNK